MRPIDKSRYQLCFIYGLIIGIMLNVLVLYLFKVRMRIGGNELIIDIILLGSVCFLTVVYGLFISGLFKVFFITCNTMKSEKDLYTLNER